MVVGKEWKTEKSGHRLTRIDADDRDCFLLTDISRKQLSPLKMQTESQSSNQSPKGLQPARLEKPVRITEQVWPKGTAPVVSIFCITYNHEKFIRDAIEGFLMQETTFPVEIFIHDDASTDDTADIVREYQAKYPHLVQSVLQAKNQYSSSGYRFLFEYVAKQRGEYIAFCEGDDYWTQPHKLEKQVRVMDSDPCIALAWTKLQLIDEKGRLLNRVPWNLEQDTTLTLDDSVSAAMPGTQSVLLRRSRLDVEKLEAFARFPQGDYPVWITSLGRDGLAHFSAECMACYRRHSRGATANFSEPSQQRLLAEMWREMAISVNRKHSPAFRKHITTHYTWASRGFADQGRLAESLADLWLAFSYSDEGFLKRCGELAKNAARAVSLWVQAPTAPRRVTE
jgi:hypothetical protein